MKLIIIESGMGFVAFKKSQRLSNIVACNNLQHTAKKAHFAGKAAAAAI